MRIKRFLLLVGAVVVGIVATNRMMLKPTPTHKAAQENNERIVTLEIAEHPAPQVIEQAGKTSDNAPSPKTKPDGDLKVAPAPTQAKKPKEPLHDPEARVAMSLVGIDPEAESYWLEAIFDSGLPDNEREDLMEDLNEEGLSDQKHLGPQDLPVILNRLAIIEEILPHADKFMVTHLGEAYKDLVNLAKITQGGGAPVR